MRSSFRWLAAAVLLPLAGIAHQAQAQNLAPTYEYTQTGFGSPGVGYVLPVPGSYTYGNTYNSPGTPISDSEGAISPAVSFYDGFQFTISGAVANAATITIDLAGFLDITNLSARIFRAEGNTPPTLRAPVGGSIIERWSAPVDADGTGGEAVLLSDVLLNPGTYILQIRGLVTGTFGGSYAGVLNLVPAPEVPLPAAAWLLISGLGALGFVTKKRS